MEGVGGDAMTSLLALLCLGLSMGTRTPVKAGTVLRPILWAEPGSVVLRGTPVTLWCQGNVGAQQFRLVKTGISQPPETYLTLEQGNKAKFPVPSMTREYVGTYKCSYLSHEDWSESSDPLELVVTGLHSKPFLSAFQSPVVASRETVTLKCDSWLKFDTFILTQEGDPETHWKLDSQQLPSGQRQALFRVGPRPLRHRWLIRCYGLFSHTPQQWSYPSDPLQLLVSEKLPYTPTLSVEPGPSVSPGDNVTLLCQSRGWKDTFLLAKEGTVDLPLRIKVNKTEETTQAQFSFHPVTSAHNGTYRCYSSNSITPYWLSKPSAPLQLQVSGLSGDSKTRSKADMDPLLIGLSIAGALLGLFLLLFLLLLHCHCRQAGNHKSRATNPAPQDTGLNTRSRPSAHIQENNPEATITQMQSEEGIQLNTQSRQDEDPREATYAQVKHAGLRWGVDSSNPPSGARLNAQDGQREEDTQAGGQAEAPEAPLEVTYAQLKHLDTAQESTVPFAFLSGEPPEEPSMYAALAFH